MNRANIRIFLAGPNDVQEERDIAAQILEDLSHDPLLEGQLAIEVVRWDRPRSGAALLANMPPQDAISLEIPTPAECDVVVVILWSKMGTPLPDSYRKEDGSRYLSGTEWEYENAIKSGRPRVLVYRRSERVIVDLDDPAFDEKQEQHRRVKTFFSAFHNQDGSQMRGYNGYEKPVDFRDRFANDVKRLLVSLASVKSSPPSPLVDPTRPALLASRSPAPKCVHKLHHSIDVKASVLCVLFCPDGQRLVLSTAEGGFKIYEISDARKLEAFSNDHIVTALSFSRSGSILVTGTLEGALQSWDFRKRSLLKTTPELGKAVRMLSFHRDGLLVASVGQDSQVRLVNTVSGVVALKWESGQDRLESVAFSPDGRTIASGGKHSLRIWSVTNEISLIKEFRISNDMVVRHLQFSPDGKLLALGSNDAQVRLYDVHDWSLKDLPRLHADVVLGLSLSMAGY